MRILVVGINYAPDLIGVAKYNAEFCEELVRMGHEVRAVAAPPYYPAWEVPDGHRGFRWRRERRAGVSVVRSPIYVPGNPSGTKRLLHHASFAASSAPVVGWSMAAWRPDLAVTVAPSLMSAPSVALAAKLCGVPSWLHVQDLEVDAAFDLGLLASVRARRVALAAERAIMRAFDRVSTICPQMMARIESKGVERWRLYEMRNWSDTDRVAPGDRMTATRARLGFGEGDLVGVYSGTMSNKQGLDLVVEAARALAVSDPRVKMVMCGEGPHRDRLLEMAVGLPNMVFMGLRDDDGFADLMRTADFHMLPQRAEAADLVLPSKLGGIFASGRPVVVMAAPGTGLANEVEGAGVVVPAGDASAFVEGVRRLVADPGLRAAMGGVARDRAIARWNRGSVVRGFCAEAERLLASAPAAVAAPTELRRRM